MHTNFRGVQSCGEVSAFENQTKQGSGVSATAWGQGSFIWLIFCILISERNCQVCKHIQSLTIQKLPVESEI